MMAMMRTNDSQNKMSCPCHTWYVSYEMFADVQRRVRIPYETLIKVSDLTAVHGN